MPMAPSSRALDEASVREAAAAFLAERVEAVAVCFINSYANDAHEHRAAAILREEAPSLLVTASCEVLPEIKEYERTSTAVVNAYLLPAMRGYLSKLAERLAAIGVTAPVQVMASNGGMIGIGTARDRPVFAVGSGPAGGVAGAARLGSVSARATSSSSTWAARRPRPRSSRAASRRSSPNTNSAMESLRRHASSRARAIC